MVAVSDRLALGLANPYTLHHVEDNQDYTDSSYPFPSPSRIRHVHRAFAAVAVVANTPGVRVPDPIVVGVVGVVGVDEEVTFLVDVDAIPRPDLAIGDYVPI